MRVTLSVIKADVGSVGGHTRPSRHMMEAVREELRGAIDSGLLIDGLVLHTGDDIALIMSHTHGRGAAPVHDFAWRAFMRATEVAKRDGLYGAGQDLLVDAPSGNLKGAGPAVAEIEWDHTLQPPRPAESFLVFTADKCGPGAYNLPFYLAFADPMYCAGLMLPQMIEGFTFHIIDMEHAGADSVIELKAPEELYHIAALLRDNERFGIDSIYSRRYGQQAVSISAHRLHTIAGRYTGKDDPIAIVRTQGIFPAPEEILSAFALAHYVGGDARGSHNMPLMPVPVNTPVTSMYCIPIVSCVGFSMDRDGRFSSDMVDFFDNPAWEAVRLKAQEKAMEIRRQGFSGPAMLPYSELEYSGFRETVTKLLERFRIRE